MSRNDDAEGRPRRLPEHSPLDPRLQRAFDEAFAHDLPLDVAAGHLWGIDRRARRSPVPADVATMGRWRRVVMNAGLGVAALCLPGLLGQASLNSLPGDVLYPVKRHHEQWQVETAVTWSNRDAVLLEHARQRLQEARAIVRTRPRHLVSVVADAGAALHALEQSRQVGAASQVDAVRAEAARTFTQLSAVVDDDTRRRLLTAIEGLGAEQRHRNLAIHVDGGPSPTEQPSGTLPAAVAPSSEPGSGDGVDDASGSSVEPDDGHSPTEIPDAPTAEAPDAPTPPIPTPGALTETGTGSLVPSNEPESRPSSEDAPATTPPPSPGATTDLNGPSLSHDRPAPSTEPTTTSPVEPSADVGPATDPETCGRERLPAVPRLTASAAPTAADEDLETAVRPSTAQVPAPSADVINDCGFDRATPATGDSRTDPSHPMVSATAPTAAASAPAADQPGGVPEPVSTDGADE